MSGTDDERDDLLLFFKALADKSRLTLLGLLAQREHSVQELASHRGSEGTRRCRIISAC